MAETTETAQPPAEAETPRGTRTSEIRRLSGVTREEGAQLGDVARVFVDPEARRLRGLSFKGGPLRGEERYVDVDDVELVGEDVVLVNRRASAVELEDGAPGGAQAVQEMRGRPVTTRTGTHLGKLEELWVQAPGWEIVELELDGHRVLEVAGADVALGADAIIVPEPAEGALRQLEAEGGWISQLSERLGGFPRRRTGKRRKLEANEEKRAEPSEQAAETSEKTGSE
jgi:sporulation protein YlmC with PRC-barrel domain